MCSRDVQVDMETTEAELKLNNATQRLQQLEQDVTLLKNQSADARWSAERSNQSAARVTQLTEEVKQVRSSAQVRPPQVQQNLPCPVCPGTRIGAEGEVRCRRAADWSEGRGRGQCQEEGGVAAERSQRAAAAGGGTAAAAQR